MRFIATSYHIRQGTAIKNSGLFKWRFSKEYPPAIFYNSLVLKVYSKNFETTERFFKGLKTHS